MSFNKEELTVINMQKLWLRLQKFLLNIYGQSLQYHCFVTISFLPREKKFLDSWQTAFFVLLMSKERKKSGTDEGTTILSGVVAELSRRKKKSSIFLENINLWGGNHPVVDYFPITIHPVMLYSLFTPSSHLIFVWLNLYKFHIS